MPTDLRSLYDQCFSSTSLPKPLPRIQEDRMLEDPQYAYLYARYVRKTPWREDEEERAFFTSDDFLLRGDAEWALLYYLFVRHGTPSPPFRLWIESKGMWSAEWTDLLAYIQSLRSRPFPVTPTIELYPQKRGAPMLTLPATHFGRSHVEAKMSPQPNYVTFSLVTVRVPTVEPEFFYCRPSISQGLTQETPWTWFAIKDADSRWKLRCEFDEYNRFEWNHHEQIFADPLTWQY